MNEAGQIKPETLLHFEGFTLDIQRRGLYRGKERVRLTAKPLETLIFLVENRGRVLQKQEILNAVWKDTFVTEDTLVHAIREVRRALSDDRDNPRFILTIPREGYRFVCEVLAEAAVEPQQVASISATDVSPVAPSLPLPVPDTPDRIAGPTRRRRWMIPLVVGLFVLIPILLIAQQASLPARLMNWWGIGHTPVKPPKTSEQKLLTTGKFSAGKPALSADGRHMLFISSIESTEEKTPDGKIKTYGDLFVRELATGHDVRITDRENPSGDIPVFTADGTAVVFSNYHNKEKGSTLPDLYKVLSRGGPFSNSGAPYIKEASGAGFSPDSQWVAYTKHLPSQKALWISPADNPEAEHREVALDGFTPRWSADGKLIAYTTSNPNGGLGDIWIVDAASLTGHRNLTNEPQQLYGLTWTPDNRFIIFASKRTGPSLLWRISLEGGPIRLLTGPTGDYAAPSMSREASTLVFSHYHGAQNLMVAEGLQAETRDLTNDEYHRFPRLSPSGLYVASVMEQPDFGEHLYVTDLLGNHTRLSERPARHPCWVAEGRLCYLQWDQTNAETRVLEVNISNLQAPVTTPLTRFPGLAEWLAINPVDDTKLAVVSTAEGKHQVVLHDLTRQKDEVIAAGSEYTNLRWSPDGSTLAWSGLKESGRESGGIWLIKPGIDSQPRHIVADGYGPVWGADVIYFLRIGGPSGLWEFNLKTNTERRIRDWAEVPYFDLVGQHLVFCQLGSSGKNRIYSLDVE
ncbi:MAG: winged helix-turn-helix domain-containing protein [Pyrinomonadaceae bacterium]|nr:winged helix-turn-helix domain-containing protein [Pyrinomonadaceae bacterium]